LRVVTRHDRKGIALDQLAHQICLKGQLLEQVLGKKIFEGKQQVQTEEWHQQQDGQGVTRREFVSQTINHGSVPPATNL
jgi:hypothetical protein